ncbi:MAG: hypothetical protein AB8B99_11595 [Phormidesmis sp.]
MARFRNQVSKGIEEKPETGNQISETKNHNLEDGTNKPETKNHKPVNVKEKTAGKMTELKTSVVYSESDLEPVNVAGFKVPYVVREHWKKGCREKRVKLSPMLKRVLADEFGLPPGFELEDL